MDIKEIPIEKLIGLSIGYFAPMNGGKTESETAELERAIHSGFNVMAYNPHTNTRDGGNLIIDGKRKFPAKQASSVFEIKQDIAHRNELINSKKVAYQGNESRIEIEGISHLKHRPIVAVGIDEVNLFCLNEKKAEEMIEFIGWCKESNLVLYVAGLLYDFRHMEFKEVHSILPYIDIKQEKKPVCKAVHEGRQCGSPAIHTMRLWSNEFVEETGLESLFQDMELYSFANKDGEVISNSYVPAPFFDKTVRIEEASDGRNIYLPVCHSCAKLPYKKEVFEIYDSILKREEITKINQPKILLDSIVNFLTDPDEGWVKREGDKLIPISYHRNIIGGYSPQF